jgi:hypothetical protein
VPDIEMALLRGHAFIVPGRRSPPQPIFGPDRTEPVLIPDRRVGVGHAVAMRLPPRWFIVVSAFIVVIAALLANTLAAQIESPAAGLEAKTGPHLAVAAPGDGIGAERTRSFDVTATVARNGDVRVQETIVQDFGFVPRHGIERVIPLRDDVGEHRVSDLVVSTSDGTPDGVSVDAGPSTVKVRIGDADTTITGAHVYRLEYDIGGVVTDGDGDTTKMALDAISAWQQTIGTISYTVTSPARPRVAKCQQGGEGSKRRCASAAKTDDGAVFTGTELFPDDAFTVRLAWPEGAVAANAADSTIGSAEVLYAVLAGLAVAAVGWRYRRRWKALLTTAQTQLWSTFGPDIAGPQLESYSLTDDPAIEFVPPMGLRPGEMGVLVEAGATQLLTATVVDLAARGALKITETDGSWRLDRRNRVEVTDDEQLVLDGLFSGSESTTLDDRGSEMSTLAGELAENLTDDLEDRGLAVEGTDAGGLNTRSGHWWILLLGVFAVAVGAGVHVLAYSLRGEAGTALAFEVFAVAVILGLGGLAVIRLAGRGLTPAGLAAVWRVRGFDLFFTGSEAMHAKAAADQGLLRQYMGYAIVFGHTKQWVDAFEAPDTSDWFQSSSPLDAAFIGFTAGSLWSPPASSSSSGFGGGGGGAGGGSGGGGGGSW